ncbi:hypothetical protein JTB14_020140 [Gonioctena quinquepunctata]|nr:hypothetical protein JTB14_020140 [Gonioctena quinquepunctata]
MKFSHRILFVSLIPFWTFLYIIRLYYRKTTIAEETDTNFHERTHSFPVITSEIVSKESGGASTLIGDRALVLDDHKGRAIDFVTQGAIYTIHAAFGVLTVLAALKREVCSEVLRRETGLRTSR